MDLSTILFLAGMALLGGFIDAIAGGGGLLTIPAMLLANIPPVLTLGTNKLQAASGALAASITMIKKGVIKPKSIKFAIIAAFPNKFRRRWRHCYQGGRGGLALHNRTRRITCIAPPPPLRHTLTIARLSLTISMWNQPRFPTPTYG